MLIMSVFRYHARRGFRKAARFFSTRLPGNTDAKDAIKIIKSEFKGINFLEGTTTPVEPACPRHSDIVIIGGGLMGNVAAYWFSQRHPTGFHISIIERDPYYTRASSVLSCGGVRHQFSFKQNVQMSQFTTEFLRDIKLHLSVLDLEPPHVPFNHQGYLFLATDKYVDALAKQVAMQNELGAVIELLSKNQLAEKFPWLNVDGVEAGSYGLYGEGWFDPWSLMTALKRKNLSNGVRYVQGEVINFNFTNDGGVGGGPAKFLSGVDVKLPNGDVQPVDFCFAVNCAGPFSGEVAKMAGIGVEEGDVPLPVEPRKRYVYTVHSENGPGLTSPFFIDTSGVYFRREGVGGNYICGSSPSQDEEPATDNLDVDYDYFDEKVWPLLAKRVPSFESLKLKSAWAGFYDYNYFDHNAIIGNHPYYRNLFFLTGFSGHGIQHALAAGRGIMELCLDNEFRTIDLTPFSFERFIENKPIYEEGII